LVIFTKKKLLPYERGKSSMRKMPVLTMVCLVALGLVAAPSYSATVAANDTPDIVLSAGGSVSFDLADFFSSAEGALTYTATGASVSGSVATVNTAGSAVFTAGDVSVDSEVVVSSFIIGNGPEVDNNNRIVGMAGGNVFYNALVPGGTINSKVNLSGLPAVGGQATPGGGTGAAGLMATVAAIDMAVADTGLVQVSRSIATGSGLTPTLNANGSYSVAAGAGFSGAWMVTLGASDGAGSKDAVHLLAAEAVAVNMAGFTAIPAGSLAAGTFANGTFTCASGQGTLAFGAPIAVGAPGDVVTLVLDYNATAKGNIAAVLFDGGVDPNNLGYTNPSAGNVEVGTKSLSMSIVTNTGTVVPAVQVAGTAGAITVTVSNMAVVKAGPVTDYALNPNAKAFSNSASSLAGWNSDLLGVGAVAATVDGDNNFASADGAGSLKLAGVGGVAQAWQQVACPVGTLVAECYAKKTAGAGPFAMALTDGGALDATVYAGAVGADWTKVIAVGTASAATNAFLVVQAADADVLVDDVCVRVVDEPAGAADLSLLGM
jgi:hypothetical protein